MSQVEFNFEPLSGAHNRSRFDCGSEPLNRYLREQASQDMKRRIAMCFVAIDVTTREIAGFYTLTATSIALNALAPELIKKLPRYPAVPAALLGRLAVAQSHREKGLGRRLLIDGLKRAARAELGIFAMLVDAKDENAQRFYEKYGFKLLDGEQRRLLLWTQPQPQIIAEPLGVEQRETPSVL